MGTSKEQEIGCVVGRERVEYEEWTKAWKGVYDFAGFAFEWR